MRSNTESNTATVVTVNRLSTEALSSLETSVDGEVGSHALLRLISTTPARGTPRSVGAHPSSCIGDATRFLVRRFLFGHTASSRADGAWSRRGLCDAVQGSSGVASRRVTQLPDAREDGER